MTQPTAPAGGELKTLIERLRADGWMVAVHNDYRQNGEPRTFWLLTHPSGRWIKGEGRTDEEALTEALVSLPCLGGKGSGSASPQSDTIEPRQEANDPVSLRLEYEGYGDWTVWANGRAAFHISTGREWQMGDSDALGDALGNTPNAAKTGGDPSSTPDAELGPGGTSIPSPGGDDGWLEIETAPRDGTQVLTYSPLAEKYGYAAVRDNRFRHGAWQRSNETYWPDTHWRPLPDPPKARAIAGLGEGKTGASVAESAAGSASHDAAGGTPCQSEGGS